MSERSQVSRFSRNDMVYLTGLLFLFTGLVQVYGWGVALIVIGAIVTSVGIAASFFLTWLSTKVKGK